jgi:hypothetical protein
MSDNFKREAGVFGKQRGIYHEEHIDAPTCFISIEFSEHTGQSFGGLKLSSGLDLIFEAEVCATFGVRSIKKLEGLKVIALRSFGKFNEPLEGIEDPRTGKRFTTTGFRRRHCGLKKTPLDEARERAQRDLVHHRFQFERAESALLSLDRDFTNWEED